MSTPRKFKSFNQEESIIKAQKLIDQFKDDNSTSLVSMRIDPITIIQIKKGRNMQQIIDRLKSKRRTISILEQIEYGIYA